MARHKRRSVITDRSVRNEGDQPLSPMVTPDPPYVYPPPANSGQQPDAAPAGRRTPPWEIARRIGFSPQISLEDPWRMNSDPNVPDLAATMNPFVGLNLKPAAPREREGAQQQPDYGTLLSHQMDSRNEPVPPGLSTSSIRKGMPSSDYSSHSLTQHARGLSSRAPPSACLQESARARRQQVACVLLAMVASLGSLLLLRESFQGASPGVPQKFGLFAILLAGLTGAPLAYMCYLKVPARSWGKKKGTDIDSVKPGDPGMVFLSTRLTAQGFAVVSRSHELHANLLLNALKAMGGFFVWNMMRTYASLSPLSQALPNSLNAAFADPPIFGPASHGAHIGISGYPPRNATTPLQSLMHAPLLQLLIPLAADITRLLGLWYTLRMFRQCRDTETAPSGVSRARCSLFAGGRQLALLVLVAVPVASVTLKQAFWSSTCLQSVTEKMVLVEPQPAVAALVLRCHAVLLAVAAALTGAVLEASLEQLSNTFSRKTSKILGVMTSLALLCCILFDVLAAAAPSGNLSSACTFYTLEAQSNSYSFKVFTTAATLARLLALLCLSFSASTFGLKDELLSVALEQKPIDEAHILGVSNQR
ncbi:hypothetical protein ACSSS7_004381 [Eimeria intestinalis]